MAIRTMDHFTVVTDRLAETVAFYAILGLKEGPRPDFRAPGAWLYARDHPVLHIIKVERMPEVRRGVLDHMAFASEGLLDMAARLKANGTGYRTLRVPPPFSRWQMFLEDPNGAEVELDFDIGETPPDDWETSSAATEARSTR